MSYITDVLLITACGEDKAVASVNAWLKDHANGQQLTPADLGGGGGSKVISHGIYAAAFNYLDTGGLEDAIRDAPWRLRTNVAAYFDDESGQTYVMSPAQSERWMLWDANRA